MTQPAISIEQATMFERCITAGGVAVFPSDTVYGLACDPQDAAAVQRIYALKQRPHTTPAAVMFFRLDRALAALPVDGTSDDPFNTAVKVIISAWAAGPAKSNADAKPVSARGKFCKGHN